VQEAVTNVLKHASAGALRISVVDRDGSIHIDVTDDGRGFSTDEDAGGFGLVGMRERVALLGGTLEVSSRPGGGTEVHAVMPGTRRAAEELPDST
jgi:signal transduction histidine kinase